MEMESNSNPMINNDANDGEEVIKSPKSENQSMDIDENVEKIEPAVKSDNETTVEKKNNLENQTKTTHLDSSNKIPVDTKKSSFNGDTDKTSIPKTPHEIKCAKMVGINIFNIKFYLITSQFYLL